MWNVELNSLIRKYKIKFKVLKKSLKVFKIKDLLYKTWKPSCQRSLGIIIEKSCDELIFDFDYSFRIFKYIAFRFVVKCPRYAAD